MIRKVKTLVAAKKAISEIESRQVVIAKAEAAYRATMAKAAEKRDAVARPAREDIEAMHGTLHEWAIAQRDDLTNNGKLKTVQLGVGTIQFKTDTAKVVIDADMDTDTLVKALVNSDHAGLVSYKTSIDKNAIKKNPDAIAEIEGISISQTQSIIIKPAKTGVALKMVI